MSQRAFDFDRQDVVMRWKCGRLTATWPGRVLQGRVRAFFYSWDAALGCVLGRNCEQVRLRIRP